ncbi:MAG: GLUG motif-containing protein [Planctomycetota bacterium]
MMRTKTVALICIVLITSGITLGRYSGGTGDANDPYRIATANDLNDIDNHVEDLNKCFLLVDDINLADYNGTEFDIIGCEIYPFNGVFDGNGHRIHHFSCDSNAWAVGLFSCVDGAQIKDVTMTDANVDGGSGWGAGALVGRLRTGGISGCRVEGGTVKGGYYVGALAGMTGLGTIFDCHATAGVSGDQYVGGLVGNCNGSLTNCSANSDVAGDDAVGGLAAVGYGSELSGCHASGTVTSNGQAGGLFASHSSGSVFNCSSSAEVSGAAQTGGLIGDCSSTVSNCFATGSVTGTDYVGGLIGSGGPILNSYSSADVFGDRYVGGLVGSISGENIENCYAAGSVNADTYAGGLAGYAGQSTVVHCYSAGSVSGSDPVGGFLGYHYENSYDKCFWDNTVNPLLGGIGYVVDPNVTGKSTAQMQTESTFTDAGWDLLEVWGIGENQTYPFLRKYLAGDSNHDGIVNFYDYAIMALYWMGGDWPVAIEQ